MPLGWCHLHIWGYWYFSWQSWFQLVLLPAQRFSWCRSEERRVGKEGCKESDTTEATYHAHTMGLDTMIFVFWVLSFKPVFSLSSFTFNKRFFSSSLLSAIRVVSYAYLRLLIFLLAVLIPACDSSSTLADVFEAVPLQEDWPPTRYVCEPTIQVRGVTSKTCICLWTHEQEISQAQPRSEHICEQNQYL